jgi:hypothetical protein
MRKRWWWRVAVVAVPLGLWFGYMPFISLFAPFSWEERDWNGDGRVTFAEYVESASIGKVPVRCPGDTFGTEYFETKSGNTIKIDCSRRWTGPHEARYV